MKIVDAQINWHEGFVNPPSVRILVDEELIPYGDRVWRKLPAKRSTLSSEQELIVGDISKPDPNWFAYVFRQGGYTDFFTWGGEPDQGFGGSKKVIKLDDGTEETIIGGWSTSPRILNEADPDAKPVVDVSFTTDPKVMEKGYTFYSASYDWEEVYLAVLKFNPNIELGDDGCWKFKGKPTKKEFQAAESARISAIREAQGDKFDWKEHKRRKYSEVCNEFQRKTKF